MTDKDKLKLYKETLERILKHKKCKYLAEKCLRAIYQDIETILKNK